MSLNMPNFLVNPPPELQADIDKSNELGHRLVLQGHAGDAFQVFRQSYETMLSWQARLDRGRYHKGLPLHNTGWALTLLGDDEEGGRWVSLAFIEDVLSRAEELPF